jgi:RND family efflux transporter MFP subunit
MQSADLERGVTKPREEPKIVFVGPGVVMKVDVKEGDVVKAGQVLAVQDDREEQAKLQLIQGELDSALLQIDASVADKELKQVMLDRKEQLYDALIKAGKSNNELDEARVAVKIADIAVKFRKQEHAQKLLELGAQKVRLELKRLMSPINGVVAKIEVKAGEGTDITRPAMQIVQNDTLKVEVDIPSTKCKNLKAGPNGDTLMVRYMDEEKWMPAKVVFLTPYADPSSGTRKVRMEMANEGNREAGLPVYVKLPDNLAKAQ